MAEGMDPHTVSVHDHLLRAGMGWCPLSHEWDDEKTCHSMWAEMYPDDYQPLFS